jgi:hypothetical protein
MGLMLGDVIPVPLLHRVLSVGDLALMVGLTLLARALSSYPGRRLPPPHAGTKSRVSAIEPGKEVSG